MSHLEQVPMFEQPLVMDNPDALKKKKKKFQNILYGQINRLMNHFKVEQAHIVKATGMKWPTIFGWCNAEVETQMLDSDLKAVANFFGVTVDFLGYGTPMTDRDLELEDLMEPFDFGPHDSNLNIETSA